MIIPTEPPIIAAIIFLEEMCSRYPEVGDSSKEVPLLKGLLSNEVFPKGSFPKGLLSNGLESALIVIHLLLLV